MNGWGIHRLRDMIASNGPQVSADGKIWYRAVPEPYHTFGFQRLRATWAVLTGKAHAVQWPEPGEFERILGSRPSHPGLAVEGKAA